MKKKIPLEVLQKMQPLIDKYRALIVPVAEPRFAFALSDADPSSDFLFVVDHRNGNGKHVVTYKPVSASDVTGGTVEIEIDEVVKYFENWLRLLQAYQDTVTIFDDPILKSYEEEFTTYFQMANEDADKVPFNFEKQLLLEQYLDWAVSRLEAQKESANEQQKVELKEMISDVQLLKDNLTQLSQNTTIKGIAKFWAKARKFSIGLIKDLLTEFKKEGIKKLVEATVKGELPRWDDISAFISGQ